MVVTKLNCNSITHVLGTPLDRLDLKLLEFIFWRILLFDIIQNVNSRLRRRRVLGFKIGNYEWSLLTAIGVGALEV